MYVYICSSKQIALKKRERYYLYNNVDANRIKQTQNLYILSTVKKGKENKHFHFIYILNKLVKITAISDVINST
jgi:hypothetical protein